MYKPNWKKNMKNVATNNKFVFLNFFVKKLMRTYIINAEVHQRYIFVVKKKKKEREIIGLYLREYLQMLKTRTAKPAMPAKIW